MSWAKGSQNRRAGPLPKHLEPQKQNNQLLTLKCLRDPHPPIRAGGSDFSPGWEPFAQRWEQMWAPGEG